MLVDEPTVGLAPNLAEQVYQLLQTARTAISTTHPAGRPERVRCAPSCRGRGDDEPRHGEGGGSGGRVRRGAGAHADPGVPAGMSASFRRSALIIVVAAVLLRAGAAGRRQLRAARLHHRLLLRDPGGELEPAGRLHRPVLAGAPCLRRGRCLHVGPDGLSPRASRRGSAFPAASCWRVCSA